MSADTYIREHIRAAKAAAKAIRDSAFIRLVAPDRLPGDRVTVEPALVLDAAPEKEPAPPRPARSRG